MSEFNVNEWASAYELSDDTVTALANQGFATRRTLSKLMPELISQNAQFKKLPLAQMLMLQEACSSLRHPGSTPAAQTIPGVPESTSHAAQQVPGGATGGSSTMTVEDVTTFLSQGGSVLGGQNCGKPSLFDPLQFNLGDTAIKHPYRDIRDFITLVPKGPECTHDAGSIQIGSQEFLLKDTKIPWERLNVAQYMEGGLRILREMALQDKCSVGELLEYVNYLVKISTLGQCFQWQSVLKYDQEYRKAQAASGFKWGADNTYLMQLFLKCEQDSKSKQPQAKKPQNPKGKKAKFDPESGKQICLKWNSVGGCSFHNCKFAHKCLTCFSVSHPQHTCSSGSDNKENS